MYHDTGLVSISISGQYIAIVAVFCLFVDIVSALAHRFHLKMRIIIWLKSPDLAFLARFFSLFSLSLLITSSFYSVFFFAFFLLLFSRCYFFNQEGMQNITKKLAIDNQKY